MYLNSIILHVYGANVSRIYYIVIQCIVFDILTFILGFLTNSLFCVLAGPLGVQVLRLCYGRVVGDAPL
jgi:hypothetical protein